MLPSTMNAITIARAGGPEVLEPVTRPLPQPGAGQVLIKVAFAGINRHDCGQRIRGFGPPGAITWFCGKRERWNFSASVRFGWAAIRRCTS